MISLQGSLALDDSRTNVLLWCAFLLICLFNGKITEKSTVLLVGRKRKSPVIIVITGLFGRFGHIRYAKKQTFL